jgi:hypothetical protein
VRNRPPTLSPLRELLRWAKAASGRLAIGFPSRASSVSELIPANAVSGMDRSRLKPRSSTWKAQNVKIVLQEI